MSKTIITIDRPENGETYKDLYIVLAHSERYNQPTCQVWRGKAGKPYAHFRFPTEERRGKWIARQKEAADIRAAQRLEQKARTISSRALIPQLVKVGSIFHHSWGYEQTNADFYEVVEMKGCTAIVREIAAKHVASNAYAMSGTVTADPGNFIGEPKRKVIRMCGDRPHLSSPYGSCGLWNGKNVAITWYA